MNGRTIARSLSQPNQLFREELCEMLATRLIEFLLVEYLYDRKYFNENSESFEAVQRGMQRGGYVQVACTPRNATN